MHARAKNLCARPISKGLKKNLLKVHVNFGSPNGSRPFHSHEDMRKASDLLVEGILKSVLNLVFVASFGVHNISKCDGN